MGGQAQNRNHNIPEHEQAISTIPQPWRHANPAQFSTTFLNRIPLFVGSIRYPAIPTFQQEGQGGNLRLSIVPPFRPMHDTLISGTLKDCSNCRHESLDPNQKMGRSDC